MARLLDLVYALLLIIVLPWYAWKAFRTGKYHQEFWMRVTGRVPPRQGERPCVWLHAVSVGEVNLLQPLIEELEAAHPDCECVISSTTDTGIALARQKYAPRSVFPSPLDFSWAVRTVLARVRPRLLVLAELELWPNLIALSHAAGIKVAVINGRLSESSFRGYRRSGPLIRQLLLRIDVLAVQNKEYANRFRALGANPHSVYVTGSLKFDGATTDRNNATTRHLASVAGFTNTDIIFLAGSTQEPEEQLALETFQAVAGDHPRLRLVIVPRHPERFDTVAALLDHSGVPWQRRSELSEKGAISPSVRVSLIDAVGELWAWWGTAHIAYVGGSMGSREGQNMIEPAAYGAVVSFGPRTRNFREVVAALLAAQAAVVVHDGTELARFVRRALEDRDFAEQTGQAAQQLILSQLGATRRTVELLSVYFSDSVTD